MKDNKMNDFIYYLVLLLTIFSLLIYYSISKFIDWIESSPDQKYHWIDDEIEEEDILKGKKNDE